MHYVRRRTEVERKPALIESGSHIQIQRKSWPNLDIDNDMPGMSVGKYKVLRLRKYLFLKQIIRKTLSEDVVGYFWNLTDSVTN